MIKRRKRMPKKKMQFKDAIFLELSNSKEKRETVLVSSVAKRVFGVKRTFGNMKRKTKSSIIKLFNLGILKKRLLTSGNIYWSVRGPGDEGLLISKTKPKKVNLEELSFLRTARRNIEKTEKALRLAYLHEFIRKYNKEWMKKIPKETLDKIQKLYFKNYSKLPNSKDPLGLFSVAGIIDFFYILKNNRDVFVDSFSSSGRFIVMEQILDMSNYRNRIQHNDELSEKEIIYFNALSEILIDKFEHRKEKKDL